MLELVLLSSVFGQTKAIVPFHECNFDRYHPVRISDYFTANTTLESAKPAYPESARAKRQSGRVTVKILISLKTGKVEKACATSGPAELWNAAEEAASKFRFKVPSYKPKTDYAHDFLIFDFRFTGTNPKNIHPIIWMTPSQATHPVLTLINV